jgi:subfamily B ATP-binding cassette protein MsbA
MQRLIRLLRYVSRYWLQVLAAVVLMAIVGLMESFRVLLISPVLNQVLHPESVSKAIPLFSGQNGFDLRRFVPHYQNVYQVVSFALIISTVIKGIADYLGTYLINYACWRSFSGIRPRRFFPR